MTNAKKAKTAREKAAAMRAEAARAERRRRSLMITAAVAVALALVVGFGVVIQNARSQTAASTAPPANVTAKGGIVVGNAKAPVSVVIYEDFQCPVCQESEKLNGAQLTTWIKDGTVKVEYRMIAILDRTSPDRYSTRSLNAAAAVANADPAAFPAFHAALYARQPAEGSPGLTDTELADAAVAAGAPESVRAQITGLRYEGWAAEVTDQSSKDGVTGTPTIQVNGTTLDGYQPATLDAAVKAAQAAK